MRSRRTVLQYTRVSSLVIVAACRTALPAGGGGGTSIGDTQRTTKVLAASASYQHWVDPSGPFTIHLVTVDLRRGDIELRLARARDALRGREKTSEMVKRAAAGGTTVLAAINADFFNLGTGENENNQVIAGEWWKGLKVTDSP